MGISNSASGFRPGVCLSTTRPTAPYEGQMVYETDTDMVAIWNGSSWRYISATTPTNGTVLQTVYAQTTSLTVSATTTWIDTGLTASITPKSTSSKILIFTSHSCYSLGAAGGGLLVMRNFITLQTFLDVNYIASGSNMVTHWANMYLDNPGTTSSVSYKTAMNRTSGSGAFYTQVNSNPATIVLMEIAA